MENTEKPESELHRRELKCLIMRRKCTGSLEGIRCFVAIVPIETRGLGVFEDFSPGQLSKPICLCCWQRSGIHGFINSLQGVKYLALLENILNGLCCLPLTSVMHSLLQTTQIINQIMFYVCLEVRAFILLIRVYFYTYE